MKYAQVHFFITGKITVLLILVLSLIVLATSCKSSGNEEYKSNYRFSYEDSFDEEQTGTLPSHWVETYSHKSWIAEKSDNNVYLTQNKSHEETSRVYLHLFDRNPVFTGKFRLTQSGNNGMFALLTRFNAEGAWVRIEYHPEKQQFILLDQEDIGREIRQLHEVSFALDDNWHDFKIALDAAHITFHVDNQVVLTSNELKHRTFGKIGFETTNCKLQIDDIAYFGNEGRPNNGVVQGEIRVPLDSTNMNSKGRPFWGLHLGVLQQSQTEILGIVGFRDHQARNSADNLYPYCTIYSNDNGLSWKGTTLAERQWLVSNEGDSIRGIWPNLAQVKDGHILMGYNTKSGKNTAYFSDDGGNSWQRRGSLTVDEALENVFAGHPWQRFMMTMPGKLSYNSYGLFYPTTRVLWNSSDEGYTWEYVYVFHRGGETWNPRSQEHQIIEMHEDTLVVYSRDDGKRESKPESKTLVKRYSTDGGRSWSEYTINNTPFVSSKCAFSVKKDPYQENTVWMYWTYNSKWDEPSVNNQPRTRAALAVSYDNTRTWQFVMDVDDWGYPTMDIDSITTDTDKEKPHRYLQKDNRFTNLALWVTPEYLHLSKRRRFRHGEQKLEDFCIFYTRVEKSKIEPYPEFPGTRY